MHDAVDALQEAAYAYGLVPAIGQDNVQATMSAAFDLPEVAASGLPDELPEAACDDDQRLQRLLDPDVSFDAAYRMINARGAVAASTLAAARISDERE